ncbi:YjcZ family sporulation protein [Halobacillus sp. BBL2006]
MYGGYPYGGRRCRRVGGYRGYPNNFALIVVLFILLIIVGAAFYC